jgi:hypothetical protein
MGVFDVLFGRKRLDPPKLDRLFALPSAGITLETAHGLPFAGVAGVVFKPLSAAEFARAEGEIDELLRLAAAGSGSVTTRSKDSLGYQWVVVRDEDLEDAVTSVHLVSSELNGHGFGEQLLAAVFRFAGSGGTVDWIYGYKRGTFWPFVPTGSERRRDNAEELRLKAALERELPIEPDLSRWLALYDPPFG